MEIWHCLGLKHRNRETTSRRGGKEAKLDVVTQDALILGIPQTPFDLFVKKSRQGFRFLDAFHNLVYSSPSVPTNATLNSAHVLLDSGGNPLISLFCSDGKWRGLKDNGSGEELLFIVDQKLITSDKVEFHVLLTVEDGTEIPFVVRGCPFYRSCTIYHQNTLVAQTSLMYKLGFRKHFVGRSKFRVTIFPGSANYNFIAALILVFLDGRNT